MFTTAELAALRATVAALLSDTASRIRITLVSDNAGGHTETTVSANFPCRIGAAGKSRHDEYIVADRLVSKSYYSVTFAAGTDVIPADRLVIGGNTYEVSQVMSRSEARQLRVLAVLIN